MDLVTVAQPEKQKHLVMTWTEGPIANMIADSLVGLISNMEANANPAVAKAMSEACECRNKFKDNIENFAFILRNHFGNDVSFSDDMQICTIKFHEHKVTILFETEKAKKG